MLRDLYPNDLDLFFKLLKLPVSSYKWCVLLLANDGREALDLIDKHASGY